MTRAAVDAFAPRPLIVVLLAVVIVVLAQLPGTAQLQAGRIDTISPAFGRPGDRVTITGSGFGAVAVQIMVDGIQADVVAASGTRVTFVVPAGVRAGSVVVTTRNPGGLGSSIGFAVIEGQLLSGAASTPVSQAALHLRSAGVGDADIEDGVMMTRLGAHFAHDATVGQVNTALARIGAGIVTMHPATLSVTLAIPRQTTLAALQALAADLKAQPGIAGAWPATVASPQYVRFDVTPQALTAARYLLPSRFPAAWNAHGLVVNASGGCERPKVPLLVADFYGGQRPAGFEASFPGADVAWPAPPPSTLLPPEAEHGYIVTMVAGGVGGANPFSECLDLRLLQSANSSMRDIGQQIVDDMPEGRFIANVSLGYFDTCRDPAPCDPATDRMKAAFARASDAIAWKQTTRGRWDDFLIIAAAGNDNIEESKAFWPGVADARVSTPFALAAQSDLLGLASSNALWTPGPPISEDFASLATTPAEQTDLDNLLRNGNLDGADAVPPNVIVVGSTTNMPSAVVTTSHTTPEQLVESDFSDRNADILAVGEAIFDNADSSGTSFSAPQVAGLTSYMWLLSPELRNNQPTAVTKRAITANARNGVIDAYASVLSLDAAALPTPGDAPVRLAILDRNGVNGFNHDDVIEFLRAFYFVDADQVITREPPAIDLVTLTESDLNGDGFSTSISRRERFDLDRVGSTQFGATRYEVVSQIIEGQEVRFDETALTDVEILCYYAYSAMYTGDPVQRRSSLEGRCGLSIQPAAVTLSSGGQQQFTASAPVTWTASGGSISGSGLYTAGTSAGTFTVRATSVSDPTASVTASVTVNAPPPPPTQVTGPYDGDEQRFQIGDEPPDIHTARWVLESAGGTSYRLYREGNRFLCPQTGTVAPFRCTPPFDLVNGAFDVTVGEGVFERKVSGTLANGRLRFVLQEPCTSTSEIVRCQTTFENSALVTLIVAPALLDFGTVAVGTTSAPQSFSITNLGRLPLRVLLSGNLGFSILDNSCVPGTTTVFHAPEGTTCDVRVQFTPLQPSLFEVRVLVSADGGPLIIGTVTVRGQGN